MRYPVPKGRSFIARLHPSGRPLGRSLCLSALLCLSGTALAQEVRISGTGGLLAVMQKLGDAYKAVEPAAKVRIVPSLGSSGAIKALQAGALELGVIARPLKEDEKAGGLYAFEFVRSPFVLVTHPRNPATSMSLKQLASYLGDPNKAWPDGSQIRPVLRPETDSDTTALRAISPEMNEAMTAVRARKGVVTAASDQESADTIEHAPGSLGAITLALVVAEQRDLKVLRLEGVKPTLAAMADGSYPLKKTFLLVHAAKPAPATAGFVKFLESPAASRILTENAAQSLIYAPKR